MFSLNFPHFHVAHFCPSAQREVVLYWVGKEREGNVTGIEVVLHVGHFSLLDSLVLKWQLLLLGCVTLGRLLNHAEL